LFLASLPSGLPRNPNVLLIRTHPNPSPSVANSIYAAISIFIYRRKTELMENGNFCLFAAN
jgi:hypothetical protein